MNDPDQGDDLDQYAQLDPEDTLVDRGVDPLDEGWSPPERPYASEDWGTTAREEHDGESIDARLARELPDGSPDDSASDGLGDTSDTDGELVDDEETGEERSGRLAATGGAFVDDEELFARDEGFSGGAASAEEAAVHTVPDVE